MPQFSVTTAVCTYPVIVENGIADRIAEHVPARVGKLFVVSTADVMTHAGEHLRAGLKDHAHEVLLLPGGEENKRLAPLETAAEQMLRAGADRSSIVIAFGGGIVNDMAGFLAAMFMRGIPVIQVPTTLLAQVDAAIGGKTGVNLALGKNLIGSFHQPLAVLIDPALLRTLPAREYVAGLYEVIKYGVIASPELFDKLERQREQVLRRDESLTEWIIAECVRIKAEVVTADEREMGVRKILNFGHTVGHALEAETRYEKFLHGEAVAFGMIAATKLAELTGHCSRSDAQRIEDVVRAYGPIPSTQGIEADALQRRLVSDKKATRGSVQFVLPTGVGKTELANSVDDKLVHAAIQYALA